MAFKTVIVTEDITVTATSDKGIEYDLVIECIDQDSEYTNIVNVGTVTPWELAALHMLMMVPDSISERLSKDLYDIVEPLLAKLGTDSLCRPIP